MITQATFRNLALAFPDAEEQPHFDKPSFRYRKKIFATLWEKENRAMVRLPLPEQEVFCMYDKTMFFPVPGTWGKQGATFVDLGRANKQIVQEALAVAYQALLTKK